MKPSRKLHIPSFVLLAILITAPWAYAKDKNDHRSQSVTVTGSITLGPTCSVETYPPTQSCEDAAFATTVYFVSADGLFSRSATSNRRGKYKVKLPSGTYTITKNLPSQNPGEIIFEGYPRLETRGPITIGPKKAAKQDIFFDSGIR